ncbi:MAG: ATP-binding protein [Candidatus Calescibacterium sp.]|nr:ATP-binding protein [Candidatus Calescibacterium sp.]
MNFIGVIVGINGSGKTTYAIKILKNVKTNYKRILIINCSGDKQWYNVAKPISINDIPLFEGIRQMDLSKSYMNITGKKNRIKFLTLLFKFIRKCVNSLVIIDDVRIISNSIITEDLKYICVSHRQRNQDIILCYHSFKDIQNDIMPHIKHITSFKTNDAKLKRSKFNNQDIINKFIKASNTLKPYEYISLCL